MGSRATTMNVFLFEDNPMDVDLIRLFLGEKEGATFHIDHAERLSGGIERLAEKSYDIILSDLNLLDSWGMNTFRTVQEAAPDIPVIILTGRDDEELALLAVHDGAQDYLVKGELNRQLLLKSMRYAVERQKTRTELKNRIAEIRALERERENMLSMFAHDIKNSLVPAMGFVERILSGKTDKMQNHLERTLDELWSIGQLVTGFLDFTRLEAREYAPALSPCDLDGLIRKQIDFALIKAEKKNIAIHYESAAYKPALDADSAMVSRVVANLLDNAVKYTDAGGSIVVETLETDKEILFEVRDTGKGIPVDKLPLLYEPFYRLSRDQKGSGLGLTISKQIIEAHGGRIWADSIPGKGSVFGFGLPRRTAREAVVNLLPHRVVPGADE